MQNSIQSDTAVLTGWMSGWCNFALMDSACAARLA